MASQKTDANRGVWVIQDITLLESCAPLRFTHVSQISEGDCRLALRGHAETDAGLPDCVPDDFALLQWEPCDYRSRVLQVCRHVQVGIHCNVTGTSTRISLNSASQRNSFSVHVTDLHCLHLIL